MPLGFMKFKFTQKAEPKAFYRYDIISSNPYADKDDFQGNSIRYHVINHKDNKIYGKKMFIYVLNNSSLITYEKIKFIPEFENGLKLELVSDEKEYFEFENYQDLYRCWAEYFVYDRVVKFCRSNKGAFDYRKENEYVQTLNCPKSKLNITVLRNFKVRAEVIEDRTIYLSLSINCEFKSNDTIYDLIKSGEDVLGLQVKCNWQSYDKTYIVKKVHETKICEKIKGNNSKEIDLLGYWQNKTPWYLKDIDINAPIISLYDPKARNKAKAEAFYIPQSLTPIITREHIAQRDKILSKEVDRYTKLSMQKRLEIIQGFLKVINTNSTNTVYISVEPSPVDEFGYKELQLSQNLPKLKIKNGTTIRFNEKYKAFSKGFYKLPDEPIVAAFMNYDKEFDKSRDIMSSIALFTHGEVNGKNDNFTSNNLMPLGLYHKAFYYHKGDLLSYDETAQEIKKIDKINFAIVVVPIEEDEEDYDNNSISSPYDSFKKSFAKLNIPSQMVSLSMYKDIGNPNVKFRLQNLILGLLCKSGGIPWVLESNLDDVDCFIGLDVGTQEKNIHYPACSVCLDGRGNLIGYYTTSIAQSGEKIDQPSLEIILNNVLTEYKKYNGNYPKHIVIHRDGFSNEDTEWYISYFSKNNIKFDLVEIRKNIPIRLIDLDNNVSEQNPQSGSVVIKGDEAYLVSTGVNAKLGAPRPLLLVHKYGDLTMEQISRQVYILSEMHVGSMRTSRLPLTTMYADKICKRHDQVPQNILSNKLYFL